MVLSHNILHCQPAPEAARLGPGRSCEDIHGVLVQMRVLPKLKEERIPTKVAETCAICVPRVCAVRNAASLSGVCPQLVAELTGTEDLAPNLAMVYPPTDALSALEPVRAGLLGDAWALPVGERPRPEPTVLIPARDHSDAYREHISAAALALDALGLWRVWLTDAQNCIEDPSHSAGDLRRLKRMDRNELALVAELVAQRQPVPRRQRPLVVILHYGWVKLGLGLGLHHFEQLPEPVRHIFVTVYETDGMTLGVRTLARRTDQVWTTCYNNAFDAEQTYVADPGAAPPVLDVPQAMPVLPQRISTRSKVAAEQRKAFLQSIPGLSQDAQAVFLFMKRHNYDTGWDILLRAFVREFPPGPGAAQLVLKLGYQTEHRGQTEERLKRALAACKDCPSEVPSNVFIINRRLADEELKALYDIADAYVEPGRGSGCMSVTAMRMMLQARPVFGPSWNYCGRCRVPGSRDGSTGAFTVNVTASIPAFTEVWQDFALLADQLDQDFVEIDEEDLRHQMRALASVSRFKRRGLGMAALASALRLADRTIVGTGLLARLEALQAEYVAGGRSPLAPRLQRRWAPRLQSEAGVALPAQEPVEGSWAPFVPSGGARSANLSVAAAEAAVRTLAMRSQLEYGRLTGEDGSGKQARLVKQVWLLKALKEQQWAEAREAAEWLYRFERSPESLLALSAVWNRLGQSEPALLWAEAAWELMRRPRPRGQRATPSRLKESWENTVMVELLALLHCRIFLSLPPPVHYYDYVRRWPVGAPNCSARPVPGTARDRAHAHARTAESHIRGDARFTNIGFAADFAAALTMRSTEDRYASAVQHFSIAVMLQPSDGQLWQGLSLAFTRQRLASSKEPSRDFLKQQLQLMEMAAHTWPTGVPGLRAGLPRMPGLVAAKANPIEADFGQVRCKGGVTDKRNEVCCASECGTCGGPGCDLRPGGGEKCCGGSIHKQCWSFMGPPPCIYSGAYASKHDMCNDGILSSHDHTCCPEECGQCGGPACASLPGGASRCCGGFIQASCTGPEGPPPCVYTEYRAEWWETASVVPGKTEQQGQQQQQQPPFLPQLLDTLRSLVASSTDGRPPLPMAALVKAPPRAHRSLR